MSSEGISYSHTPKPLICSQVTQYCGGNPSCLVREYKIRNGIAERCVINMLSLIFNTLFEEETISSLLT